MVRKINHDETLKFLGELSVEAAANGTGNESYRLGRLDKATRRHQPNWRSGDAAIIDSSDLMNRRTRDMYLNNGLFKRATDVLRDLVVGTGLHTYADPIDHTFGWDLESRSDEDLMRSLDYALEADDEFLAWAMDPAQCDVAGRFNFFEMQSLAMMENMVVGDVIMLERTVRGGDSRVPLQYQLIEREQIDSSKTMGEHPQCVRVADGFEFDRFGRELGCWLYDVHPYDDHLYTNNLLSKFVPSARYIHIYKPNRPSQGIGATWHHAMGQPMVDRDKYTEAEMRTAVKAALMCLVANVKNPGSAGLGMDHDEDDYTAQQISLGVSPIAAQLGPEEKVQVVESSRPNKDAEPFFRILDHDIAGASNLSYYSLTGRFNETNYGGFRGALNLEDSQVKPVQAWLGRTMVLPVRRRWNSLAAAIGVFRTFSAAEIAREKRRFNRFDVIGPGRFLLDSDNETKGAAAEMRGGFTTIKIQAALRGYHWIRLFRQRYIENRLGNSFGLAFDYGNGGGGSQTTQTPEQLLKSMFSK